MARTTGSRTSPPSPADDLFAFADERSGEKSGQEEKAQPQEKALPEEEALPDAADAGSLEELYRRHEADGATGPGTGRFVPGEGSAGAPLLFVGEQPGDQEDIQGRPFVGPAGQMLNRALADVGIDRGATFVTNAVKRFHFTQRGPRRIHEKPSTDEIRRERWWLEKEIALVSPRIVVALGATALQALAGKALPLGKSRGALAWPDGRSGYVTVHPSYLLRLPDEASRSEAYAAFVADLRQVRALI